MTWAKLDLDRFVLLCGREKLCTGSVRKKAFSLKKRTWPFHLVFSQSLVHLIFLLFSLSSSDHSLFSTFLLFLPQKYLLNKLSELLPIREIIKGGEGYGQRAQNYKYSFKAVQWILCLLQTESPQEKNYYRLQTLHVFLLHTVVYYEP